MGKENAWDSNFRIDEGSVDHIPDIYSDAYIFASGRTDSRGWKHQQMEDSPLCDSDFCLDYQRYAFDAAINYYLLRAGIMAWT